jgi:chromosome segregation ATPase
VALLFAAFLNSCKDETTLAKVRALESEIDTHSKSVTKYKQDAQKLEVKFDAAQRENAQLKERVSNSEKERAEKAAELDALKKAFEDYKIKYKTSMAKRVPGMQVADFAVRGQNYTNVMLTEMTGEDMNFHHSGGLGRVRLTDLPEQLRDTLGLTIQLAVATNAETNHPTSTAWDQQLQKVRKARITLQALRVEMDVLVRRQQEQTLNLHNLSDSKKDTTTLKKTLADLDRDIGRLQGRVAAANVNVFEEESALSKLKAQ